MIKKNRKWIVGVLAFCLIWCVSVPVSVYALNPTVLIDSATIAFSNGSPYVSSRSGQKLYCIDLGENKTGTITLSFSYTTWYGTILFSDVDIPSNVEINYYFLSSDFYNFSSSDMSAYDFVNIRYIYLTSNRGLSYTIQYKSNPDPTPTNTPTPTPTNSPTPSPEPTDPINPPEPTNTPTPMPTGSGGSGIPLHYLVPFDYYMIAIIILLGGLLVCQLFKN